MWQWHKCIEVPTQTKSTFSVFYVMITKQPEVDCYCIFQITKNMETKVSFNVYWGRKRPSHCYNCQRFFTLPRLAICQPDALSALIYTSREIMIEFWYSTSVSSLWRSLPRKLFVLSKALQNKPFSENKNLTVRSANSNIFFNSNSNQKFSTRDVDPAQSYVRATSGHKVVTQPLPSTQNSNLSVPAQHMQFRFVTSSKTFWNSRKYLIRT